MTVLATQDSNGNPIADIDGSTWDPFAQRLLFTTENASAPTYSATPGYPSQVVDVSGALGRGGYEGIQDDEDGNIWIVEDIGGANKPATTAKIPNSFVYRYVPAAPGDLAHGKLQVLQVLNASHTPITKASQTPVMSPDQVALHTYGQSFDTRWVTIHDTAVDGTAPFNANTAATAADGTPFKRPENGMFRPDGQVHPVLLRRDRRHQLGATAVENNCCGGWTGVFKLTQSDPSAATGKITLFYKGDMAHAGFDNIAFFSKDLITFVEDAGDGLHTSRNALDSGFIFDVTKDYRPRRTCRSAGSPRAATRRRRSTPPTAASADNEGDNEITGIHVSDGDAGKDGILGAKEPHPFEPDGNWRVFYTQQHGDNPTYEVIRPKK